MPLSGVASDFVAALLQGSPRALARAASLVENRAPGYRDLLRQLHPHTGKARLAGITGAPGAGKSTLANALIAELRRRHLRVAVLAVDPSSPFTGGAILGDRIRMLEHHADPGVAVRSLASRGALGGLAPAAFDLAALYDAAGFDWVLVETVGVGQDEVDVARLAGTTVVVLAPGLGDGIQAIKAGILEIADVFALNKADQPGADRLEQEMNAAFDLGSSAARPPMVRTIATDGTGIPALIDAIESHAQSDRGERNIRLWEHRLRQLFAERVADGLDAAAVTRAARRAASRESDPYTIIEEWLRHAANHRS